MNTINALKSYALILVSIQHININFSLADNNPLTSNNTSEVSNVEDLELIAHIEDEIKNTNSELSNSLKNDISWPEYEKSKCSAVVKNIDIKTNNDSKLYFVTTKDNCGGGASSGPIWIIRKHDKSFNILLSTIGQSIFIKKESQNTIFPDLYVTDSFGPEIYNKKWSYQSDKYIQSK